MAKETNATMELKEDRDREELELSTALKNTMMTLIKAGFDKDRGVYTHKGSMSDIAIETCFQEGFWLGIFQRLDNK